MVLMVLAIGSMAERRHGFEKYWAPEYAKPAFSMLPAVMIGSDLTSAHCLLLFAYTPTHHLIQKNILYVTCQTGPSIQLC